MAGPESPPVLFAKMLPSLMQSAALGVYHKIPRREKTFRPDDLQAFLCDLKQSTGWVRETPRICQFISDRQVAEVLFDADGSSEKLVHLEAYPR